MSLPVPSPTQSYWQTPPHRLASYRSPFPETADVVIIGSGITGTSIARNLYELNPSLALVIIEARQLCSGATGRNGGHCKPGIPHSSLNFVASYHHWPHRVEKYGIEEAIVMSRFESRHPRALVELAKKYDLKCDVRELETVDAYYDLDGLRRATRAAKEISKCIPELIHHLYSSKEAQEKFRVSGGCVGAITYPAGQLWPYKLVTQIVEMLVNNGVNLQTETLVTSAVKDGDKWKVETPRGSIVTKNVVHATNGYIQYLVPSFGTVIKASRGHMTAQTPPKNLSEQPLDRTYSFVYANGKFDYFIQQPVYDGCKLMLGGGYYDDPQPNTFNDAEASESVLQYLRDQLPHVFQWEGKENPEARVHMKWSGIMGFSKDGIPWVGTLSEQLGGGNGQWICAGYTGEGTFPAMC
jgi:glycine/D-amino acid oxidase-like deaminating enzyme